MLSTFKSSFRSLSQHIPLLISYELIFRALHFSLIVPLLTWIYLSLLLSANDAVLSNWDIAHFLITPKGLLAIFIIIALSLAVLFIEQAGILIIALAEKKGTRPNIAGVFFKVIKKIPQIIQLGFIYIIVFSLGFIPLALTCYFIVQSMISGYDIYYLTSQKPPQFWYAAIIIATFLVPFVFFTAFLYTRWIFSLPLLLIEQTTPLKAVKESFKLSSENTKRLAAILVLYIILIALLTSLTQFTIENMTQLFLNIAGDNLKLVIPILAGIIIIQFLIALSISFVSFCGNNFLIVELLVELRSSKGFPSPITTEKEVSGHPIFRYFQNFSKSVIILVSVIVLSLAITIFLFFQTKIETQYVEVTAHRGASKVAPENTLSAIKAAITLGADFAEIDVQETADGKVILIHDFDLQRVAGVNKRVEDLKYDELKNYDVGSWFSSEFKGERIPRLEQAIDVAKNKIKLNIELKFSKDNSRLAERVLAIIEKKKFQTECILSSLELNRTQRLRPNDLKIPIGFISFQTLGHISELNVDFVSMNSPTLRDHHIRSLHKSGKQVHAWAVYTQVSMLSLIDRKVDNIITDEVESLIKLQKDLAGMDKWERLILSFYPYFIDQ